MTLFSYLYNPQYKKHRPSLRLKRSSAPRHQKHQKIPLITLNPNRPSLLTSGVALDRIAAKQEESSALTFSHHYLHLGHDIADGLMAPLQEFYFPSLDHCFSGDSQLMYAPFPTHLE
jgi:hypothetical protein